MFGQDIPWQNKTKYLDIFIDKKMSFIPHIDHIVAKTSGIKGVLASPIGRRSKVSIHYFLCLSSLQLQPSKTPFLPIKILQPDSSRGQHSEVKVIPARNCTFHLQESLRTPQPLGPRSHRLQVRQGSLKKIQGASQGSV